MEYVKVFSTSKAKVCELRKFAIFWQHHDGIAVRCWAAREGSQDAANMRDLAQTGSSLTEWGHLLASNNFDAIRIAWEELEQ